MHLVLWINVSKKLRFLGYKDSFINFARKKRDSNFSTVIDFYRNGQKLYCTRAFFTRNPTFYVVVQKIVRFKCIAGISVLQY